MSYDRMRRVNELLQRELGELCERFIASELKGLLTITKVETSPDLRHARVYYSILGAAEDAEVALKTLRRYRREFQHQLATHVKLKYTPVLSYHSDPGAVNAERVLSILQELDLMDEPDAGPAPSSDDKPE